MKLNPHTFGSSRTAEILVEILNEHNCEKYTEKVSHFVSRNYILINNINDIKDEKTKSIVGQLLIDNVNNCNIILPDKIKSFMKNLIIGKIKAKLIRNEISNILPSVGDVFKSCAPDDFGTDYIYVFFIRGSRISVIYSDGVADVGDFKEFSPDISSIRKYNPDKDPVFVTQCY